MSTSPSATLQQSWNSFNVFNDLKVITDLIQKNGRVRKGIRPFNFLLRGGYFTSHVSPARIMSRSELKPFFARTSRTCSLTPSL